MCVGGGGGGGSSGTGGMSAYINGTDVQHHW